MLIYRPIDRGTVLSSQDFKAGELVTHAQSCLWICGFSELADVLNTGKDPHADLGALLLGVSYDEFVKRKKEPRFKDTRQAMKPPNFGFGGGMAEVTLVLQQREQGPDTPCPNGPSWIKDEDGETLIRGYKGLRFCILMGVTDRCGAPGRKTTYRDRNIPPTCVDCLECGAQLRELWRKKWPENRKYFNYIGECQDNGMVITPEMLERWSWLQEVYSPWQQLEPGTIMQHVSGRLRKPSGKDESPFCALANGFFQGLLADIAKHAHRIATRECYDKTVRVPDMLFANSKRSAYANMPSPLYGSRIPLFAHDELIGEHPWEMQHDAPTRISEIMRDTMRWYCPDLADAAVAEPTTMLRWDKRAEKVVHRGRLAPWTPDHNAKTCVECKLAA